jgi:DNA gyrase/topoisomerase IV subunit B
MAINEVKRKGKKIKEAEIEAKDQRWHCRNRVTLVFGSNDVEELDTYTYTDNSLEFKTVKFHQAKSKAIEEILDNCIDEFYRGHVTEVRTTLSEDGASVTIEDNGIGFPPAKAPMVYSEFRTGSKFKDLEVDSKGFLHRTLGQNGLGAAATCLTSDEFFVTIKHYNSKKEQVIKFIDGAAQIKKSKAKPFKGASGVKVQIKLAKEVYKNIKIDKDLLEKRIVDLAYNNPGLRFIFNGTTYHYKKGLFELAQRVSEDHAQLIGDDKFVFEGVTAKKKKYKGLIDVSVSVVLDKKSEDREKFISFVNSTPTFDGGFHHDRIKRVFINTLKDKLEREAKKAKVSVVDNDILNGMTFVIGIIMPNPRFESQTKRKLVKDSDLDKAVDQFMEKYMAKFLRNNKDYLEHVLERAKSRVRFAELKDASKMGKKAKKQRVEKLLDANERKDRSRCALFICEGDSAIGGLRSARNKLYQGGIALKGKPMNVTQATIKDVLNNTEFSDIMASVGLVIGQEAIIENLRYPKIVFLADSDVDGGHINTLLVNFFFTYWPELFENGCIQIAKAPLFEIITNKDPIYAESEAELESIKAKGNVNIKEIQRNKGLGEMSPEAFKHVLNREDYTKITIDHLDESKHMLHTCFGKDTQLRKDLLLDGEMPEQDAKTTTKKAPAKKKVVAKKKVAKKVTKKKVAKKAKKKVSRK